MTTGAPFPADLLERIARAIHERYRRNQRHRKAADDPAMQPWDTLPIALKDSNRAQAEAIPATVGQAGYRVARLGEAPLGKFSFEELEKLARLEHDRWVAERRSAGWGPGPVKDVERKLTPYLVSWEDLAPDIREYDRDAVRAIPEVLAEAGLGLYRS